MICLPPQGTPPPHSSRYGPQHTQHTASIAATPHYPQQGRKQTLADAPTPALKRSMLTPFGGPRPTFGAKARERWFTRSNGSDLKKKLIFFLKKRSAHIIVPGSGWLWRPGAAAAAALPDVGGSGGWLCQYPVAPTQPVLLLRGYSGCVCDCDGGVVVLDGNPSSGGSWCI